MLDLTQETPIFIQTEALAQFYVKAYCYWPAAQKS